MFKSAVLSVVCSLIAPSLATTEIGNLPDGFKCHISSKDTDTLQLKVQFPSSAYFAIGYGQGMSNIDMVMFSKDGVKDLWSEGYGIPSTDSENNYVNTMQAVDNDVVTITTFRSRETGDSAQDFQFDSCGTSHEF